MTEQTIHNANGDDVTKYAVKLKALLQVAADQAGTPEGDLAQARAFEFMQKYGLDASMVKDDDAGDEPRTRRVIKVDGIYALQLQNLACEIAYAVAGAHPLVAGKGNHRSVHIFGFESAVLTVELLYASLSLQVLGELKSKRAWNLALNVNPHIVFYTNMEKFVWRRDYIMGFAYEVGRRLADARNTTVAAAGASAELAIRDRDKVIYDWAVDFVSGKMQTSKIKNRDYDAMRAGIQAGKSAAIGDSSSTLGGPKQHALN